MAHPQQQRTLHDKASYSILPTPPSPSASARRLPPRNSSPSPSLSPSSNSNSAASGSTEPTTPPAQYPAGRVRKQYPEGVGRVPLHRRGTSKTYERLEDLLREAGYKETRIFTPETERTVSNEEEKELRSPIDKIGAFFSGLVPNRSTSTIVKREEKEEQAIPVYDPPASPLVNRTQRNSGTFQQQQHTPSPSSSQSQSQRPSARRGTRTGESSGGAVTPRRSVADIQQHRPRVDSVVPPLPSDMPPPLHHPRPVNRYYQHHPSSSRSSGLTSPPPPPVPPTPTRASAYLRHMTSFDRPQSTPPPTQTYTYTRITDDAEQESLLSPTLPPRLPSGWLDNVKRAREYFGGAAAPAHLPTISASPANTVVKLGRSVSARTTRGRLSDRTNAHATATANASTGLAPPLLTTRLSTGRARRSESQVSVSRVVCRSRGSSPVRRDKGKGPERATDLELRGQLEFPDPDELNLALARERFLGGWGTSAQLLSPPRRRMSFDSAESDISSEGEEELTLARILVPSRLERPPAMERSRSVRSLRRCLELDAHGHEGVPPVPPLPGAERGRWSVSLSWGRARSEAARSEGEDAEVYVSVASGRGSGATRQRQRGVLPSWGN